MVLEALQSVNDGAEKRIPGGTRNYDAALLAPGSA
jgi:hypothetical protein